MKSNLARGSALAVLVLCSSLAARAQQPFVDTLSDTVVVFTNYVPPPWAPPYDNLSRIRYYYLPDCGIYYDVWEGMFWYPEGTIWVSSAFVPALCPALDLYTAFIVLLDFHVSRPWLRDGYYHRNYPAHLYDHYRRFSERHRFGRRHPMEGELVPRAFNENSNRVTFMRRTIVPGRAPGAGERQSAPDAGNGREVPPSQRENPPVPPGNPVPHENPVPQQNPVPHENPIPHVSAPAPIAPPEAQPRTPATYDRQVQEVPMRTIARTMPAETRKYNYGSGYRAPPTPPPARSGAAPARSAPAQTGGTRPSSTRRNSGK